MVDFQAVGPFWPINFYQQLIAFHHIFAEGSLSSPPPATRGIFKNETNADPKAGVDVGWRVLMVAGQDCAEKSSAEIQVAMQLGDSWGTNGYNYNVQQPTKPST